MKSFIEKYVPTTLALVLISGLVIAFGNMKTVELVCFSSIVIGYMLKEGLNKIANAIANYIRDAN